MSFGDPSSILVNDHFRAVAPYIRAAAPWCGSCFVHATLLLAIFYHPPITYTDAAAELKAGAFNGSLIADAIFEQSDLQNASGSSFESPPEKAKDLQLTSLDFTQQEIPVMAEISTASVSTLKPRPVLNEIKNSSIKRVVTQRPVSVEQIDLSNHSDSTGDNQRQQTSEEGSTGHHAILGQGGISSEGVDIVFGPKPPYPIAARRAGFEGAVVLRVLVDETGTPQLAEVRESSGRTDCDESAKRTVENKWRFEPHHLDGIELVERQVVVRYALQG